MLIKNLGKAPSGKNRFQNIEATDVMSKDASKLKLIAKLLNKPKSIKPANLQSTNKTDLHLLNADALSVVWFGHSSYLLKYKGKVILIDPVLFGPASPLPFGGRPFKGTDIYSPDEIPEIDLLILTHDHYDHLSYETLMTLKTKIKKIVAPLKVSSHLLYWGFDKNIITETDWKETNNNLLPELSITALPARHFSGRVISRNKTRWCSYALQWQDLKIFIGGDSGYDAQFKKTGDQFGPFDIAFVECGQYGDEWPHIHMFPEETAQAASDLRTAVLFPVHWAKFALALHAWDDPISRLITAAKGFNYEIVTPMIGEEYVLGQKMKTSPWWLNS